MPHIIFIIGLGIVGVGSIIFKEGRSANSPSDRKIIIGVALVILGLGIAVVGCLGA